MKKNNAVCLQLYIRGYSALLYPFTSFPRSSVVKNVPANVGDEGSIPPLGRSPGEGNDNHSSILLILFTGFSRQEYWSGLPFHSPGDHYIYYCGKESLRRNGVAIIVNKRVQNAVLECNLKNDRMISVHFQGKPFNITVNQVYALTSNAEEAKVEWFYEDLQHLLELTPQKDVWSQEIPGVTSKFGLGVHNEAGQKVTEFCHKNTLGMENTLFKQHKRRLYTWTSPDG